MGYYKYVTIRRKKNQLGESVARKIASRRVRLNGPPLNEANSQGRAACFPPFSNGQIFLHNI